MRGICQTLRYRKVEQRLKWIEFGWKLEGINKEHSKLLEQGGKNTMKNKCVSNGRNYYVVIHRTHLKNYLDPCWKEGKKVTKVLVTNSSTIKKMCWNINAKIHYINGHMSIWFMQFYFIKLHIIKIYFNKIIYNAYIIITYTYLYI